MNKTVNVIRIIRPQQWVKNLFVFMPLVFGGNLFSPMGVACSLLAFVSFSMAASSIYCLNDVIDVEADRRHPDKCRRPIAAGLVSQRFAIVLACVLGMMSMALPLCFAKVVLAEVMMSYLVLNVAYCLRLKQYAILDVCIVAFGFVLRVVAGGAATDIELSRWLVMMTFLLTLFLAFAKRRDDVLIMNVTGEAPRRNTNRYNLTFVNQALTITGSVMLVCYLMYTMSPEVISRFHSPNLYMTTFFVILGLLRYIQLAVVDEKSGDPTGLVMHDRFVQLVVAGWFITFIIIIYA